MTDMAMGLASDVSQHGPVAAAPILFQISCSDSVVGVSRDQLLSLTRRAAQTWQHACDNCNIPVLIVDLHDHNRAPIRKDGQNIVRFSSGSWCPEAAQDAAQCYDPARRAITHIYTSNATSSGVSHHEVDIEINVEGLSDDSPNYTLEERIQATLVHELGHALGLSHSCAASLDISCRDPLARVSVMYPNATELGRPLVFQPSKTDIEQLTALYPKPPAQLSAVEYGLVGLVGLCMLVLFIIGAFGYQVYQKHQRHREADIGQAEL